MKKGKKKKKLLIFAGIAVVVLGGIYVAGKSGRQEEQIPMLEVVTAETGDVEQTVDATGTVVSEEEKTYFSPVNARIEKLSFEQGDSVKSGAKLVEFNLEDLEKEQKKAELNLESGKMDFQDAVNKSDKAVAKQESAKGNVAVLEQKVADQKNYVAALQAQLSAVNAQAQKEAQAQQAAAAAEAERRAEAQREAEEERNREIQREYSAALATYQNETLPNYQQELGLLNSTVSQTLGSYNQAESAYQMAFSLWQLDPNEENSEALDLAEQARSQAEIEYQDAKNAYEAKKAQQPQMPVMSDFTEGQAGADFVSDGTEADMTDTPSQNVSSSASESYTAPDTSGIQNALEQASSDLAELQSELASEKSVAEADAAAMTKEEKEKMKITNNLSEMDAKTAEELVEDGKKGISADFNGVISKADIREGATVTQGMELFTLQNTEDVSVDVNVSKYDFDKIQEKQKAEITLAGKTYQGTVTKVSHIAEPNDKGTPVISATVKIDDPDENIFLGVDAKVKIHAAKVQDAVILPVEVVNIGKTGSFCYVLEDGIITKKEITTGISSADYVEVTEGLEAGTEVIRDLGEMAEGMPAQAMPETGADVE